jgi:CubicO group peptidase (beta-lactamase class C family)
MRELVLAARPEVPPDTRTVYSDLSFLILGFVLEEILQLPLDEAVQRFVWKPMRLKAFFKRTDRSIDLGRLPDVAATENSQWRGGVLQGQVHDDNCWAMGGYGGHAGAFGTVEDVLRFARALAAGFLSPTTLKAQWTRVPQPPGCERTLGWDTPSQQGGEPSASTAFSPLSVGHLGFTGTSLWIDPPAGVAVALLTNRVHPSRENILIRGFRPRFHQLIRQNFLSIS